MVAATARESLLRESHLLLSEKSLGRNVRTVLDLSDGLRLSKRLLKEPDDDCHSRAAELLLGLVVRPTIYHLGQPEDAMELLRAAVDPSITGIPDRSRALLHYWRGLAAQFAGQFSDARRCFREAHLLRPNWDKPLCMLADIDALRGSFYAARQWLGRLATLGATNEDLGRFFHTKIDLLEGKEPDTWGETTSVLKRLIAAKPGLRNYCLPERFLLFDLIFRNHCLVYGVPKNRQRETVDGAIELAKTALSLEGIERLPRILQRSAFGGCWLLNGQVDIAIGALRQALEETRQCGIRQEEDLVTLLLAAAHRRSNRDEIEQSLVLLDQLSNSSVYSIRFQGELLKATVLIEREDPKKIKHRLELLHAESNAYNVDAVLNVLKRHFPEHSLLNDGRPGPEAEMERIWRRIEQLKLSRRGVKEADLFMTVLCELRECGSHIVDDVIKAARQDAARQFEESGLSPSDDPERFESTLQRKIRHVWCKRCRSAKQRYAATR